MISVPEKNAPFAMGITEDRISMDPNVARLLDLPTIWTMTSRASC